MDTLNQISGECRTYTATACTHDHSFAQLILPLQGALFIKTPIHQFELDETRLFFLPPQCQHTFHTGVRNQFLVLDIPHFMLPTQDTSRMQGGLSIPLDDRWQALRFLMLTEIQHSSAVNQDLVNLFHYAYRLLTEAQTPRSLQYIRAHYAESLELRGLAALEGYTPTYYCEWFRKWTGTTPKAYIQQVRLQKAKELLAHTDLPILQIAQQVGYEHHASLTRLFQQQEGVTPAGYRQQIHSLPWEQEETDPKNG